MHRNLARQLLYRITLARGLEEAAADVLTPYNRELEAASIPGVKTILISAQGLVKKE